MAKVRVFIFRIVARHACRVTEYTKLLRSKGLWPVDPEVEHNWSGRGQHVEYRTTERKLVDAILQPHGLLGSTNNAVVDRVRCRRIYLARKTIRCDRTMTREKAIDEVAHLNRLEHAHLVRVIGTYICGPELSILLYPAADWNLSTFLQDETEYLASFCVTSRRIKSLSSQLRQFIVCLSNALAYIHNGMTKHMDIKPQNILVKMNWGSGGHEYTPEYEVYIADFGIARSYASLAAMETEGPTMFTRKYAAPEVVDRGKRGLPADIFSLGCVFTEITAVLSALMIWLEKEHQSGYVREKRDGRPLNSLHQLLESQSDGDASYQANVDTTQEFLDELTLQLEKDAFPAIGSVIDTIKAMLLVDPASRPSAADLVMRFGTSVCCTKGPVPLAVAGPMYNEIFDEDYSDVKGV